MVEWMREWGMVENTVAAEPQYEVIVIGAGVCGIYTIYKLTEMGNLLKFVDLRPVSVGHDICRGGSSWIGAPGSTKPAELHPTQDGMNAFGDTVYMQ